MSTSPTSSVEDLNEIRVSDREIDALMNKHGFSWQPDEIRYESGDQIVSGDFATAMTLEIKKLNARIAELEGKEQ